MAKKDYREKIEEDRQQIEVESELSRLSRSKHKSKKRKSPLISILLVTFILIPLSLLVYVKFFYEPKPVVNTEATVDDEKVQMETNDAAKKQQEQEDKDVAEQKANEEKAADKEKAADEEKAAEQQKLEAEKKAAEEQAKKDAQLAAAKKAEQEAAAKKAAEEKAAQEAVAQQQQKPASKSHTVQPNDTLYSIAMKYYGDPNAVEKIRAANGLSSDSIPTGRTLVLP